MSAAELTRLVPVAQPALAVLLDPARGALEAPIRSEIFGPERFAQHGRSLAATHAARYAARGSSAFFPRLRDNIDRLREAYRYIGQQATGYDVSPAAEWLLDNFHLVEAQLREIHDGLPLRYFRDLPVLTGEPLVGLPRVYGVAWAFVAHTDSAFDEDLLLRFLKAYEETRELTLGELWALPTTLRVVLIENLRRLAERTAAHKAARELANVCCDDLDRFPTHRLDAVLALLNRRAVGESFLGQFGQRLQDAPSAGGGTAQEWLLRVAPHLAEIQTRLPGAQAADNLSVGNAITSLRSIGDADWPAIVEQASALTQTMLASPLFAAERDDTRDQTLHAVEKLARKSGRSEREVAETLIGLMRGEAAGAGDAAAGPRDVARHWLEGDGRPTLLRAIGLAGDGVRGRHALWRRVALPVYLASIALVAAVVIAELLRHGAAVSPGWLVVLAGVLAAFPASEAAVALINRIISESTRPQRLPRLALGQGLAAEQRTMVVIPAMLTSTRSATTLSHQLQLHHLANPERETQFALLTDYADADAESLDVDRPLLDAAVAAIERLNALYPGADEAPPRFVLLHRPRRWSESERRWMGWERKRGKLEELLRVLDPATRDREPSPFIDLGRSSRLLDGIRYVLTLDSDTRLPPGRLRELVGIAAHPDMAPVLSADGLRVVRGYAILQPHVATPLPAPEDVTHYHWLFGGQSGIDPYSVASSEVYQDVFDEGTFTGKGLLDVRAVNAVLGGRLPASQILSHDLLEGSIARCAAVTDVAVMEEAPFHADVAGSRVHRWTRGDWQLLPLLFSPRRFPMRAINRWKMLDNLRRSLVAPASLALIALAAATSVVSPWAALGAVLLAFGAGPLLGALAGFSPSRDDVAHVHFYRQGLAELARALLSTAWLIAQLVQLSLMAIDAIGRALWRTFVTRRRLLEWTTAAAAQAAASTSLPALLAKHRAAPIAAALLAAGFVFGGAPHLGLALPLCVVWALSPVWTWWVSRPRPMKRVDAMSAGDRRYLSDVARDTWRLFERCVTESERHLPPDNLQVSPHDIVAHRTSPTNVGLYLLSTACARRFGWIGRHEMIERIESTLATLESMPRYRGHFFNWYDTSTATPLLPLYVSTVDSGNLCLHLLATAQACLELAREGDGGAAARGLQSARARVTGLLHGATAEPALAALLEPRDLLSTLRAEPTAFAARLDAAEAALATAPSAPLAWAVADLVAASRSALRDTTAGDDGVERLRSIAGRCQRLAVEADFAFLFHSKRRLFHIGFRVAEHQLDASFYDLLASEARSTGLWAIAKGDAPAAHWAALGRPFYAVGALAGLRSWSGSMFEYLMPTLVLDEPHGSVLQSATGAAVQEHIAFGREHHVPWGISESAYAGSDHTLAYQYAPQGVPALALRRTPADELVIAPYASALAAQVAPHRAASNLRRLERAHARERYGFIESLDYTPSRQTGREPMTRVMTFMAHHQGMSIVALADVLLDRAPRRWGSADPRLEAVSSLLHERAPREVPVLREALASPPTLPSRRGAGLLRDIVPGMAAIEPTQLLSNGRYAVQLRSNGAGSSRWGPQLVTRTRDDPLRDACGSFCYLRWDRQPQAVSLTQHPAPDRAAHYQSAFHGDRVVYTASWSELEATTTVWVSPEDDIEFRRVVVHNLGERELDVELLSAFEPTLADPRADESHPAFSNLFIAAEWLPAHLALMLERKPRLPTDKGVLAAHFVAEAEPAVGRARLQVDRAAWLGRNRLTSHPLAAVVDAPEPTDGREGVVLDTHLDPMAALSLRLQVAPKTRASVTFCTAAADSRSTLRAVIDKYRQHSSVERASMMSATLASIRLREMGLAAESLAAIQTLTTLLAQSLARPHVRGDDTAQVCDKRLLWRFGISGDRPIVLVSAGVQQGYGLLRTLAQALRVWSWGGIACDLVVVNHEPASYVMALSRQMQSLKESHAAAAAAQPGAAEAGFHVIASNDLHGDETTTLRALARLRLNADGRPLAHHVRELVEQHEARFAERQSVSSSPLPARMGANAQTRPPTGDFASTGGEFRFDVSALVRPLRPWVNVFANPDFGAQVSEAGGGYTWALNSRLNMLTPWSNDPVGDPPGEWLLLQDTKTMRVLSVTPSASGDDEAEYRVAHGQGYTVVNHRRGALDVSVSWCVDPKTAVKQVRLRLVNRGHRTLGLRAIGVVEWILGGSRSDRATTLTSMASCPSDAAGDLGGPPTDAAAPEAPAQRMTVLYCTQRDRSAGFGGGTAFFGLAGDDETLADWTCDRRECFDSRGRPIVPDQFGQASGGGLDPCAALATRFVLRGGESLDRVFLLGWAASPEGARAVAEQAARVPALRRMQEVRNAWDEICGASVVKTPDPLFDAMVNRWLPYQVVACRLWARAGFYQAGGAYGYRDQLQDALSLAWSRPDLLRAQIVLSASRQFAEGDVQHWWHAPTGAGVRTHFSDDLLWLPFALAHYVEATGDRGVLDEPVAFLEGIAVPDGAEDAYYAPTTSVDRQSVYEHGARAIDHSLRTGAHGLPLMGTGDWNDGMNRVGHEGRGESVWLAWFLIAIVDRYAPLATARGDLARAERWRAHGQALREAIENNAWDGEWYRRAFFDDGSPLGSQANAECRIDSIAQAWSVLSKGAPEARARAAMRSWRAHLVDAEAGLSKLLAPPLAEARPSAGYIQAYPPGVRENGGQYSHAAVWALMAEASLGDADAAYESFAFVSAAHRARDPRRAGAYGIEPYVVAGDIYGVAPYVGRGGWSWYTGAAGWLHRAALESMLGLRLHGDEIAFEPCLPSAWNDAELTLVRGEVRLKVLLRRPAEAPLPKDARRVAPGERVAWKSLGAQATLVVGVGTAPSYSGARADPISA